MQQTFPGGEWLLCPILKVIFDGKSYHKGPKNNDISSDLQTNREISCALPKMPTYAMFKGTRKFTPSKQGGT